MSNLKRSLKLGLLTMLVVGALSAQVGAVGIGSGDASWHTLPGTTVAARPELAGTVIQDVLRPFKYDAYGIKITGVMQDRIVREARTGTLDFYHRIMVDRSSNRGIKYVARYNFAPPDGFVDVDWRIDGVGHINPKSVLWDDQGQLVLFNYSPGEIHPGYQSRFSFVKTGATQYSLGTAEIMWQGVGGGGSAFVAAFQPLY